MLAQSDLSSVPASDVKNILIVMGFLLTMGMNAVALMMGRRSQKREITGTVESRVEKTPALKADVDEEFDDVDDRLTRLQAHIDIKFTEMAVAAQARMDVLRGIIAKEVTALRVETDRRVEAIHEKIHGAVTVNAEQNARIDGLNAQSFQHGASITALQGRISQAVKPR